MYVNRHFQTKTRKLGRLHIVTGGYNGAWKVVIDINNGAGYKNGFTVFFAYKCAEYTSSGARNKVAWWQAGVTRNANVIPTVNGAYFVIKHAINLGRHQ